MLSEEEKKAIEYAKGLIDLFDKGVPLNYLEEENDIIKILLNIITKLQKENKEKDRQIKDLQSRKDNQEKRFKKYKENIDKQHEEIYENLVSEQEKYKYLYQKALDNTVSTDKENIQLKKQIDLMVEKIYKRISAKELNKYCNKQKNNCKNYEECFNCIKQYFENKAKGE